jgi:glutamate-ammonia-ligase adenylyltransferase
VDLISPAAAQQVGDAYRLMRAHQHRLRLDGAEKTRIHLADDAELVAARANVLALWQTIFKVGPDYFGK